MKAQILFLFSIYYFLIGSTPVMKAQTGKFYSTDKELSNSLINAVYQDRKGFIWIATENGLNKFDGVIQKKKATEYYVSTGLNFGLRNNNVLSIGLKYKGQMKIPNGMQKENSLSLFLNITFSERTYRAKIQ